MNLVDEIIEILGSKEGSLSEALLKTKILLHKIGHKELVDWVNNELNGYPTKEDLPEYRTLPAQVMANAANMAYQITSHPIPIGHLSEEQQKMYTTARLNESLAVLEKLVSGDGGSLQAPIPMEVNGLLSKGLGNGYIVQRAWCQIGQASVEQIFIQVRSRLLDFVLVLNDQLGDISDGELKSRSSTIDASSLFNNAIFGDNTTIVVGNSNKQKVLNVNLKGNFQVLAEELMEHGVSEEDVSLLKTAINVDEASGEVAERKFGTAVKDWLRSMLAKAIDASWQIELGIASGLLSDLLKKYYGWN